MTCTGKACDGSNSIGMFVGRTIGHESTVAVPYEVDAIVVDSEFRLHFFDDVSDIGRIVDFSGEEVAAGVRSIPEAILIASRLAVAVWGYQQKPILIS